MAQTALSAPDGTPLAECRHRTRTRRFAFEVAGKPVAQGSMKAILHKHTKFPMVKPDNEKALKAWRGKVAEEARDRLPDWLLKPLDQPVFVSLVFVRERGDDYLKDGVTLRKGARRYPETAPDVDKLTRAILDALTGVVFVNDSRVVTLVATKRYAEPGEAERTIIEVVPQ